MITAALTWGAVRWMLPIATAGLAFLGLIIWAYGRAPAATGVRLLAGLLKIVAVALLLICLLEPLISGVRPRPGANLFAILVDNSRSMRIANRGVLAAEQLPDWLAPGKGGWRARLEQDFDVRVYAFDRDVRQVDETKSLAYDGDASNLSSAMATIGERLQGRPLAGLLLVSDGNATDLPADLAVLKRPSCPIFPVWSQTQTRPPDARLELVQVSQTHFETSPTTVAANVVSDGLAGQSLVVQLVDAQDKILEEQTIKAGADGQAVPIRFRFRPETSNVSFHRLRVFAEADRARFLAKGQLSEATPENNTRTMLVDRGGGPYRILYVAGRPNWEFKFLRRALQGDEEIHLVGLLRIANKEPKFQFRDQGGTGQANRFFEGFEGAEQADNESYDQPVFARIDVRDSQELPEGFPSRAETLFAYDAVILDDVEATFFSQDQMLLLRRYVSQRGGGLLMLGGVSSFAQGGYARTPLGEMLPVYLNRDDARTSGNRVQMTLTREGMLETWTRLRPTEDEERQRLQQMPAFQTLNAVGDTKPGAMLVAEALDRDTTRPAIAAQRFGKGRTAAVMIGDVWQWSLQRQSPENTDPAVFWRQLVRWLVAEVPKRVEVQVEQGATGQATQILVMANNSEFQPDDDATAELAVRIPSGNTVQLTTEPSKSRSGAFVAEFWPQEPGGYHVAAKVVSGDGQTLPTTDAGWVFAPVEQEFQRLDIDRALLTKLAADSGGRIVDPDRIGAFVSQLQRQPVPVTEHWVAPLWHQAWVFSLAMACLCAEWGLRRWKGLA
jgi:uncharacterized membrane protein